ncbi:MAG: formate dehydrogenase subunit alpha [Candidatus Margulisbacteria bacterium]|nr:formate dehydrogenase subunit alpha [Candidatus Margulisiibacteriota bacterium]MBU1022033.1 formate dehydrogenase subunit alpha [Candidatus Margulisiibacteriota bacterium]MBU1729628.1 formate dehydrogenase subunit alpha [Candidatus Margulisiibacteriota bacterium]MBU1954948.1 formate dehydrogenase subunit alpha [Candidatus Margulisiibacteriota bacterium]
MAKEKKSEVKNVLTTCIYCGCGCQFYFKVKDGKIIGITPSQSHPVSQGQLCVKGWNASEFVHHPERLTHPLIKKDGKFKKASWEQALKLIAKKFTGHAKKSGSDSVAFFGSAKCTNEENFLIMKLARAVFKTNNIDHCARLCHASTVAGLAATFGSGAMTNSIGGFEDCDVFLVTGSNTTEQHPLIGSRIINAVKKGATLILVDPRAVQLAKHAKYHLPQNCGSDVAWLNGMMHVIIKEGLEDKEFIKNHTEGYEELKKTVEKYTPEYVEKISGIPADKLAEAARAFAKSKKSSIVYSMGITQHTVGVDNVKSCANLSMLTGNIGRASTGVNPLRGQNNVQGACDVGALVNVYCGYQKVTDAAAKEKFEKAWGVTGISDKIGAAVTLVPNQALEGKIKALYIMGENPMVSDPNITHVEKGLKALDFLVVQDIFLTETAQLADVVLPGTSYAEKDGTYTNTERRVERIRKAIEPIGDTRPDWKIICDVATACGYKMDYPSPKEIFDELAELAPIYHGMDFDRLEEKFGLQWPCPTKDHPGTPFLHKDGKFSKGKGTFFAVEYKDPAEMADAEYPLTLTTGRSYFHWHTRTLTRRTSSLEREVPESYVEINPADAKKYKVRNGTLIKVSSRRGTITVRAKVTEVPKVGTVFIPFHFAEGAANRLTNDALDPGAKIPEYKVCAVKFGGSK